MLLIPSSNKLNQVNDLKVGPSESNALWSLPIIDLPRATEQTSETLASWVLHLPDIMW